MLLEAVRMKTAKAQHEVFHVLGWTFGAVTHVTTAHDRQINCTQPEVLCCALQSDV